MRHDLVINGSVESDHMLTYKLVPFQVPEHIDRIDVAYSYDAAISSDPTISGGNVVDIGIFDPRGAEFMGAGFRGWSGSERLEFFITADEASSGYIAGPIQAGEWNIVLGFYKVADKGCHYQVTVTLHTADNVAKTVSNFRPRLPVRSDSPRKRNANNWYKGELHCHSLHSDGDSTPQAIVRTAEALGLDFLALTDHNNYSQQMDLNSIATDLVLIPGYEVTTYQGHWNIWGDGKWIDFRVTSEADMTAAIQAAAAAGYLASCNHPRPYGPDWNYAAVEGYQCVEVWNGAWYLLNDSCLAFWETRLKQGQRLVAVGGSDCHLLYSEGAARLAHPTMFIHCEGEPSAAALLRELQAGHAFVSYALDGPQLYLTTGDALMGDGMARPADGRLPVQIEVIGGSGGRLEICTADGIADSIIVSDDSTRFNFEVDVSTTPYVRVQLRDAADNEMLALTNPIYVED